MWKLVQFYSLYVATVHSNVGLSTG